MENEEWIKDELTKLDSSNLLRKLYSCSPFGGDIAIDGDSLINFSSNNYLNLSEEKSVIDTAQKYLNKYGTGSQASRLITGTFPIHEELEKSLAEYKCSEAALIFGSGFLTNIGVISALASRDDTIFADKLCHASIMDGIILSRANLKRFKHNSAEQLDELLKNYEGKGKKIVVTESVFSMDGDIAPLKDICDVANRHGAIIIVDEAHSTGIFGKCGNGLINELGLKDSVNITMGTFSKAFGSYGGYVVCSKDMRSYLINKARSFIYTTSLPPAVIGSIVGALNFLKANCEIGDELLIKSFEFRKMLSEAGLNLGNSESQIIPLIVGENDKALSFANLLKERGIKVNAIRPPTVPKDTARLRFSITRKHSREQLKRTFEIVVDSAKELGVI